MSQIKKMKVINDRELSRKLWDFYHTLFASLNERTPLAQSLDADMFNRWLLSELALKLFIEEGSRIVAFAVVSEDLTHDPLLSIPFFTKNYPDKRVFQFPAIGIDEDFAKTNPQACEELMREMMAPLPDDAIAVFLHSESINPALPRLIRFACRPRIDFSKLDAMGCVLLQWKN